MNPVQVGAKIRTVGKLLSVEEKAGMLEVINEMTVEIEAQTSLPVSLKAFFYRFLS